MKELTAREAGAEAQAIDHLGDAPFEDDDGYTGLIVDLSVDRILDFDTLPQRTQSKRRKQVRFLRAFARRGILADGLPHAGVTRDTVTNLWRKEEDGWFNALYLGALEEAADKVEAELHRRAVDGVDEPVMFQGQPTTYIGEDGRIRTLTVKKYSDQLILALAKGVRRDKFGDKVEAKVDLTARVGVLVVPGMASPDTWENSAREAQAKYAGNVGEKPAIEHNEGEKSK